MKRRFFSIFLVFVLTLSVFTGCSKDTTGSTASLTKVTLNEVAHSIFYAPQYVALELGYFKDAGIDLTLVTGFGADKTMTALLAGEADIGFMGSEASVYTYLGGAKDYPVNFAQLTQRAGNFLVARSAMDHFSWKQLNGSKILGGRKGGMPEMVFEYILKKNGMIPNVDVMIDQSIDFGSTAAAFSGGQGDFTIEFEPHATALENKGDGVVIASLGEASGFLPYTSYCAKQSYISAHPDTLQQFCDALQRGMEYVGTHSAEEIATTISPQFAETDLKTLTKIVTRYQEQKTWKENLVFEKDSFTLLQDILEESGELSNRVPYQNLVTTTFAKEAIK